MRRLFLNVLVTLAACSAYHHSPAAFQLLDTGRDLYRWYTAPEPPSTLAQAVLERLADADGWRLSSEYGGTGLKQGALHIAVNGHLAQIRLDGQDVTGLLNKDVDKIALTAGGLRLRLEETERQRLAGFLATQKACRAP